MPSIIALLGSCLVAAGTIYPWSAAVAADRPANPAGEPWSNPPAADHEYVVPAPLRGHRFRSTELRRSDRRSTLPPIRRICSAPTCCPPPSNKISHRPPTTSTRCPRRNPCAGGKNESGGDGRRRDSQAAAASSARARCDSPRAAAPGRWGTRRVQRSEAGGQRSDLRSPTSDLRPPTSDLRPPTSDLRPPCRRGQELAAGSHDHGRRQPGDRAGAVLHRRLGHAQDRSSWIAVVAQGGLRRPRPRPLGARQQVQLLRCGNKLLLVSITPGGAETLTEVTDPLEVDRIAGICQQAHPKSATTAFRQVFQQLAPGHRRVPTCDGRSRRTFGTRRSPAPGHATETVPLGGKKCLVKRKSEFGITNLKSQISNLGFPISNLKSQIAGRSQQCPGFLRQSCLPWPYCWPVPWPPRPAPRMREGHPVLRVGR